MEYTKEFLDLFFLCGGVIRSAKYRNRRLFAIVTMIASFIIGEFGNFVGLVNASTIVDKSETVVYLVGYILCLILCYCIKYHEQTLVEFVDNFQRYVYSSSSIRLQLEIVCKRYLLRVFLSFYISLAVYIVPIISLPFFVEDAAKYGTNILLPHWYECPNNDSTHLNGKIIIHICWRINSDFEVIASSLLQFFLSVIILSPVLCTTIFCLIVQHYVQTYCGFLKRKLRELHGKIDEEKDGTCESHLLGRELVETMKHYQFLYRFVSIVINSLAYDRLKIDLMIFSRSMRSVTRYLDFLALVSIVPSFVINVFLLFINVNGGRKVSLLELQL